MSSDRKAHVAYLVRFTIGMVLYSLAIFANRFWLHSVEGTPWRFAFALLPMIGVLICAWAMMRLAREADEMQARKVMEALVVSAAGTVITSIAYSLLEEVGAPHVSLIWVGGAWALFFGVGMLWSTWRYR